MRRLVIAGAGSLGRELSNWGWEESLDIAFIDDGLAAGAGGWQAEKTGALLGLPVLGPISLESLMPQDRVIVAVASPAAREMLANKLSGCSFATFRHRTVVGCPIAIGRGSMLFPYSVVSVGAVIGQHVIVNVHSSIGHDVTIGDFCTIASGVDLCGRVTLDKGVTIHSGARVLPGVQIGCDATIGAGAVVMRNVPEGETWVGNPARKI